MGRVLRGQGDTGFHRRLPPPPTPGHLLRRGSDGRPVSKLTGHTAVQPLPMGDSVLPLGQMPAAGGQVPSPPQGPRPKGLPHARVRAPQTPQGHAGATGWVFLCGQGNGAPSGSVLPRTKPGSRPAVAPAGEGPAQGELLGMGRTGCHMCASGARMGTEGSGAGASMAEGGAAPGRHAGHAGDSAFPGAQPERSPRALRPRARHCCVLAGLATSSNPGSHVPPQRPAMPPQGCPSLLFPSARLQCHQSLVRRKVWKTGAQHLLK